MQRIFERIIDEMRGVQARDAAWKTEQRTGDVSINVSGDAARAPREPQIQAVIDRLVELGFNVHRSTGVMHTVLGGVGGKDDFDLDDLRGDGRRQGGHRIVSPYKLASRNFRPGGTVVKVGDVEIGGDRRWW